MLITSKEFANAAYNISQSLTGHVGIDFETTGLSPYKARAFILGFTDIEGHKYSVRLEDPQLREALRLFFGNRALKYAAHNAKFELGFLKEQFGIEVPWVWDTEAMARLERNNHRSYSLQACAERIGASKYPAMIEWLAKRGNENMYHKAPPEIIEPYVEQDAWLSWELCRRQIELFRHWDQSPVPIREVVRLEMRTLPHLFEMENKGLWVDVSYCRRALDYERERIEKSKKEFERLTGTPFVDSRKTLKPIFDTHGICYGSTALGNASFREECLSGAQDHPIVREILSVRSATKRSSAYWENFLELEHNGVIHPTINGNRAKTGRMSIQDPSCQNWPRDDEDQQDDSEFPVRRAFIARPDCEIVSMDFSQMEFRAMCDEAQDMDMITAIEGGQDVHQWVAERANVPRSLAKNGRFAKLYGAGVPRVAETLGVSYDVAKSICDAIDESSPRIAEYSRELVRYAQHNDFGFNWLGRRYYFDSGFEFKYPNYRIQGGCGEYLRFSICDCGDLLKKKASKETFFLIPIHDENLFNIHKRDMHLLPELKDLMIKSQRNKKRLAMDVSVHVGPNFFDMRKVEV